MRKIFILVALSVSFAGNAMAESVVRDSLASMILRYRETKSISPATNREISLSCAGEVLKDYVQAYFFVIDSQHLNKGLISNYNDAWALVEANAADAENVYPKLRDNLVESIRQMLTNMRTSGKLNAVPQMTVNDAGLAALQNNFAICNDTDFINAVAQLAPLSGSYSDMVEAPTYKIPVGANDGDYASTIDGKDDGDQGKVLTKVNQSLSKWLYEIYKR